MITSIYNHIKVFNDSSYPYLFGGSKARKLKFILNNAKSKNANAVVSAGSASSNHARDCALACAQLGWPCTLIIHDREDYTKDNLFLMKLSGAHLIFCELKDVSHLMDQAMLDYQEQGLNPYYIWGGGHSVHGSLALKDAVNDFVKYSNGWVPDFVVVASGTGGTQAGLHVGFEHIFPEVQVIGISIAREKERGLEAVTNAVNELTDFCSLPSTKNHIEFIDEFVAGGYAKSSKDINETIKQCAKRGLLLDSTYTGKAFYGMKKLIDTQKIPLGSNVLFWHTGGIFNLLTDKNRLLEDL